MKSIRRAKRAIAATLHDKRAFFNQFIRQPDMVGSICPSGAALSRQLLHGIPIEGNGLVIDLGAGSGPVSEGMLHLGIAKDRILAVEALDAFKAPFSARCPGVPLVIGDARDLKAILDREAPGREVCAVVSSLPFRVLGPELTHSILDEIHLVLGERGGRLMQYSYAWWLRYPLKDNGFEPASARMVWNNLPPARVEAYLAAVPRTRGTTRKTRGLAHFVNSTLPGKATRAVLKSIGLVSRSLGTAQNMSLAVVKGFTEAGTQIFRK